MEKKVSHKTVEAFRLSKRQSGINKGMELRCHFVPSLYLQSFSRYREGKIYFALGYMENIKVHSETTSFIYFKK